MRVMSTDEAELTATVIRGWGGSTAIAHESDEVIWINPRFTSHQLSQAVIDEINSWPSALFRVVADTLSVALGDETIELPATFVGAYNVIDVRKIIDNTESTAWPRLPFRLQRGVADTWTATSTSGLLLRLLGNCDAGSLYVEAAAPFDASAATIDTDLEETIGLTSSQVDLAMLGAKYRVLLDAEAGRSQRDATDSEIGSQAVPPMAAAQLAQLARTVYLARRTEEIQRLRALYTVRAG
jgi:hypothetical protein